MEENVVKKEEFPKCPLCGADMKIVRGKFGTFLACSTFKETGCKGRADDPNRAYYTNKYKKDKSE